MTITYRVLGQLNPTANVETTVYTVPAATQTVVSTVAVCNLSNVATTFSLAVKVANATVANKSYINYQTPLPGNDTMTLTLGLTLGNTDVISANCGSANVAINVFGSEIV